MGDRRLTAAALAALLIASGAGVGAPAAAQPPPIIDMHLHALKAGDQGPPPQAICAPYATWPVRDQKLSPEQFAGSFFKQAHCPRPLWSPLTDEALRTRTLQVLRERNITAIASGEAEVVAAWMKAEPGRIIPALYVGEPLPTIDSLRALHAAGRLKVLGEIGVQYLGIAPDDPRLEPYWTLAEELDIPVAIHVGPGPPGVSYMPGAGGYRAALSNPLRLEDVLVRHPKLRLYVMHAGWPMADEMIALLYAHPHVYVDTGVIDFVLPRAEFHRYLRRIVDAGLGERVMFGSDNMLWPETIVAGIEAINSADFLTAKQKRDILHDNAARFLRLETHRPKGP